MNRYLLDTDHLTLHEQGHEPLRKRLAAHPPDVLAVSVVSAEESLRGRLAVLSRRLSGEPRVRAYLKPVETMRFLNKVNVLPFDQACEQQYQNLLSQRLRVGTKDLLIAASALAGNWIVVTRNRRDFEKIPGLVIEDWSTD
jgi:tRNA(fMet)-specific endonuclease VapC